MQSVRYSLPTPCKSTLFHFLIYLYICFSVYVYRNSEDPDKDNRMQKTDLSFYETFYALSVMDILSRGATMSKFYLLHSKNGPTLNEKNLLPVGEHTFPFRVDTCQKECDEMLTALQILSW